MSEKWQQWMPFHIDRFFGSASVQAMPPAARMGYLSLLTRGQWQSDDCTISSDPIDLADISGLGDELWAVHGPRILRNFVRVEGTSKLRNLVCFHEWSEAKRIFESRRNAAKRTNSDRWANSEPSVTDTPTERVANRSTDTITGTVTVTRTKKEQKPSRAKAARATKTAIADARHAEFKAAILRYWESKNPGVEMPWDGREGKALGMFLRSAPHITIEQFTGFLRNRFKSEVNHGERCSQWIAWVTSYAAGPMDRFGKTIGGKGNGKNYEGITGHRIKDARVSLAKAAFERGYFTADEALGSIDPEVSGAGDGESDAGIPGGLREVDGEILDPEGGGGGSGPED
jgi:hypothetical protein